MTAGGFVYVMTNPAIPDYVKIGRTERSPELRAIELSGGTAMPLPFSVYGYVLVEDSREYEAFIHLCLAQYRVPTNREFFRVSAELAWSYVSCDGEDSRVQAMHLIGASA